MNARRIFHCIGFRFEVSSAWAKNLLLYGTALLTCINVNTGSDLSLCGMRHAFNHGTYVGAHTCCSGRSANFGQIRIQFASVTSCRRKVRGASRRGLNDVVLLPFVHSFQRFYTTFARCRECGQHLEAGLRQLFITNQSTDHPSFLTGTLILRSPIGLYVPITLCCSHSRPEPSLLDGHHLAGCTQKPSVSILCAV